MKSISKIPGLDLRISPPAAPPSLFDDSAPVAAAVPKPDGHFSHLGLRQRHVPVAPKDFELLVAAGREEDRKSAQGASGARRTPRTRAELPRLRRTPFVPGGEPGLESLDGKTPLSPAALLAQVFDWPFVSSLNTAVKSSGGAISEIGAEQPATLLSNDGFLPVGFSIDPDGNEELWVFVREDAFAYSRPVTDEERRRAAAEGRPVDDGVQPYVEHDFFTRMQGFFDLFESMRRPLRLVFAWMGKDPLNRVISHIYFNQPIAAHVDTGSVRGSVEPLSIDVQSGDDAVIRQARNWIKESIFRHASDIHIEPEERSGRIRIRVDGILEPLATDVQPFVLTQFITWVKAQSGMDISDNRRPLDGSMRLSYTDAGQTKILDVRISSIPVIHGQKMVLRLLDPNKLKRQTSKGLGNIWDEAMRERFASALATRDGIVLVTGPTGSGKTTTLNVALTHLIKMEGDRKNIVTIEDPVEYSIRGANQTQVNDAAGVSFASTLRSLLRQDPDIMLVGEIRDRETAQIAVQAALTGHLILATLHTNDSLGSVSRMQDLGVTPFLLGSTLRLVQAQRLVRRVCTKCSGPSGVHREDLISAAELPQKLSHSRLKPFLPVLVAEGATVYRPHRGGCIVCNGRGFDDRIAVMEMAASCPELVAAIEQNRPGRELEAVARKYAGFRPMIENAVDMVAAGITSLEEVASISLKDLAGEDM